MMTPVAERLRCGIAEPGHVEGAVEIDRDHLFPFVGIHRLHRVGRLGDAGVVDQHVEPAQRGGAGRDHVLDVAAVGDVAARVVSASGNAFANDASASASMSQTNTRAPLAANARAISRPMPDAPAVIRTRWVMA